MNEKSPNIDVTILIVNYNTAKSVINTMDSIYQFTDKISFEIFVIDNGSTDEDICILRQDTRCTLLPIAQNIGFGPANNEGAKCAKGRYIFCLNPDTLLLNNAIYNLVKYLDEHQDAGIVGGNLFDANNRPTHSFHRLEPGIFSEIDFACGQVFRKLLFGKNTQFNHTNHPLSVTMITGADLMIRRDVWQRLQGFDESFFMYNEDADLCKRTHQIGYQVVSVPTANIIHLEGQSIQDKEKRMRLVLAGRNTFFYKYHSYCYCEWANRLYRIENQIASAICAIGGNKERALWYKIRAKWCYMMAPLLVNGRFLLRKPTGVEQYAINMIHALRDIGCQVHVICPRRGELSAEYDLSNVNIIRRGITHGHVWEQCFLPIYRMFHHEGNFIAFCGLGSILCPHEIVTIHDVSFLHHPQWFNKAYYWIYRILTPLSARMAKIVITVSQFSALQIREAYPYTSNKLHVIPCALPQSFSSVNNVVVHRGDYFLSVASLDPRKNIDILIRVMQSHPEWHLKLVGNTSRIFASSLGDDIPSNVEILGYVNSDVLVQLYSEAKALIFPSLYEGFGIPLLEAMSMGCPVLCSNIPVLQEVLDSAPIYFDPNKKESVESAIEYLDALSEEEKIRLIQRGYEQVSHYSWIQSAQQLKNILEKYENDSAC